MRSLKGMRLAGGLFVVLTGFFLTFSLWPNSQPTIPDDPQIVNYDDADSDGNIVAVPAGTVIADDETYDSEPKQISVSSPAPTFAKTKPVSEPVTKYVVINNRQYPLRTYELMALPNDTLVNQWWVANAQVEQAWSIPRGPNGTLLAIIDTGFALKHEEFTNRWYQNPDETGVAVAENPSSLNCADRSLALDASCNLIDDNANGIVDDESGATTYQNPSRLNCTDQFKLLTKDCNRIDDDANGYIDDVTGWDFINNDNSTQAGELNPAGDGTTHATMVAGVAAATGNNAKGIAGIDWGTKILPIQALDDDSYGDTLSVGRSIYYAIDRGADVISISLGTAYQDDYVREAIEAATAAGIVVVAASGNQGCECISYPARYPEVIAVGALNSSNTYASFSSWGSELDILAPGTSITTPTFTSGNQVSAYASGVAGTSFSAPMVAGIITLMLSNQPETTPLQLIGALTESNNRLALPALQSRDNRFGFGKLDAFKTIQRMASARHEELVYSFDPVAAGSLITPLSPVEEVASYTVHQCSQGMPTTPVYELLKSGIYNYTISKVELRQAVAAGYTTKLFAYACIQQPHDTMSSVRDIVLFKEFKNLSVK